MNDSTLIFLGIIILVLAARYWAATMDRDRVHAYIEARGGAVLYLQWSPFGRGWFGEKGERIYELRYLDSDRNEHEATCKTSPATGVYFTEDRIVFYATTPGTAEVNARLAVLEHENRRLRAELEKLKNHKA